MNTCSLLIPCHNAADFLPRLWETVERQTVAFDEVLCFDDGSTDNTAEVAEQLGARVVRSETNHGPAHARNQLARESQCTWLHFHDADDLLQPTYLERVKERIAAEVEVVVCNADWQMEDSGELDLVRRYTQQRFEQDAVRAAIENPVSGINGLCRKETFLSVGGFDEALRCWEDGDLYVRLAAAGARFCVVEEVLVVSLRHPRGLSQDQILCAKCRLRVLQRYARELEPRLLSVIAEQAEDLAANMLFLGDRVSAAAAVDFCREIGGDPPRTNNPLLIVLKRVLPPLCTLRLQQFVRRKR